MSVRFRAAFAGLLIAVLLPVTALGAGPAPAPLFDGRSTLVAASAAVPAAFRPLPACRYQDIKTRFGKYRHWRKTLLDTNLRVGSGYKPRDLVSVSRAGIGGSGEVRTVVIDDLRAMAAAARRAGKGIAVRSAYRSYSQQISVFNGWVAQSGYQQALRYSARPGHSEHQLGTAIDFRSSASATAPWNYSDWGQTPSGRWMQRNAWRYGWVMSYPSGKQGQVCYGYEPWHWRYVGRQTAREVRDSGLTLRKFLWRRSESR